MHFTVSLRNMTNIEQQLRQRGFYGNITISTIKVEGFADEIGYTEQRMDETERFMLWLCIVLLVILLLRRYLTCRR